MCNLVTNLGPKSVWRSDFSWHSIGRFDCADGLVGDSASNFGPDSRRRLDFQAQKRLGKLRDWRNEAAESNGVTTLAILPNYAMFEVARVRPHTADELAGIAGVGERRVEKWGSEILGILR